MLSISSTGLNVPVHPCQASSYELTKCPSKSIGCFRGIVEILKQRFNWVSEVVEKPHACGASGSVCMTAHRGAALLSFPLLCLNFTSLSSATSQVYLPREKKAIAAVTLHCHTDTLSYGALSPSRSSYV